MEKTSFYSQGAKLAANLYHPERARSPLPAVLVMGSWTTVKEQMAANYAPKLAAAGYLAMTFDFFGFGESGGEPRDVERPQSKAEDIVNAALYLQTRSEVSAVGVLAICASAGYAVAASLREPAFQSLVMVAPWLHDRELVNVLYGSAEAVDERLEKARAAREHYVRTGQHRYVSAASDSDPTAAMCFPGDALDYYLNAARGRVPSWSARFALAAWKDWLEFDAIALAPELRLPTRIVTGPSTATPFGVEKFRRGARVALDVHELEGTQFDFYDRPQTVEQAARLASEHFAHTLGSA